MRAGQRRVAVPPPPVDDAGRPELVELLRDEIRASGPITFARFMERALYEPGLGYYETSRERTTRAGDFLTAPELHPIFGHVLARQVDEMWHRLGKPAEFVLREHGAGRGTLGAAIAEGLELMSSSLAGRLRYEPLDAGDVPSRPMTGVVVANELLDALPVHRVVKHDGELRESYVGWVDDRFVEVLGQLSSDEVADWFMAAGVELEDGQRAEACPRMASWLGQVAERLVRGYVLLIDYAAEPADLYGPQRRDGTLRAFRSHHVGGDPLSAVGSQDLTATVDLGALRRFAGASGLSVIGQTTQAELLVGAGLEEVMTLERARQAESWEGTLALRSAVMRLLDPRQLGGYAVVVLGRDVPTEPPLGGLAFRLSRG